MLEADVVDVEDTNVAPTREWAMMLRQLAIRLSEKEDFSQSVAVWQKFLVMLEELHMKDTPEFATGLLGLGKALAEAGALHESVAAFLRLREWFVHAGKRASLEYFEVTLVYAESQDSLEAYEEIMSLVPVLGLQGSLMHAKAVCGLGFELQKRGFIYQAKQTIAQCLPLLVQLGSEQSNLYVRALYVCTHY